jgi:poly(3-hydroxybutyrate) depolymerase
VHDICTGVPKSLQRHFEAEGAGHYGIFSGRRWREHVYPFVKSFILDHNAQTTAKPVKAIAKPATKSVELAAPATELAVTPATTLVAVKAAPVAGKKPAAKRAVAKK